MSTTSRSVAQAVAEAAFDLDDSFDVPATMEAAKSNVAQLSDHRRPKPAPRTLAECVPLLTIALQYVDRGPAALTVEGVEEYRATAIRLLEHVRPVIEREAGVTLASWAAKQVCHQEPT